MDKSEIVPEVDEIFNIDDPYVIDQSFSDEAYTPIAPQGGVSANVISYLINNDPSRMVDLGKSFIRAGITVRNTATDLTPNMQIALANNAIVYLFSNMVLKINGTPIEQYSTEPGVFNTMLNMLMYSKAYSTSDAALSNLCWSIDDHSYFTVASTDGATALTPSLNAAAAQMSAAQATTLSSGMANSVNMLPFVPSKLAAPAAAYAGNLGTNYKYSTGFEKRHNLIFQVLKGFVNNATFHTGAKGVTVTFQIPLSHLFLFAKTCDRVLVGGTIEIQLTKNSDIFKALVMDKTPLPAAAGVDGTNIQTYPITPGVAAPDTGFDYTATVNNFPSPWVALSGANFNISNFVVDYTDWQLYLRCVKPKSEAAAHIIQHVAENKSIFYNTKAIGTGRINITGSGNYTLATIVPNSDFLVFAFMQESGNTVTNAVADIPNGKYIGASTGSRTRDGASNYSVFDPLLLNTCFLTYGSKVYPIIQLKTDWTQGDYANMLRLINLFRTEYMGIDDGEESSPSIDASNWINLYPFYVIDMRAKLGTIGNTTGTPSNNTLTLNFGTQPPNASMYYMFIGNAGYEINTSVAVKLY